MSQNRSLEPTGQQDSPSAATPAPSQGQARAADNCQPVPRVAPDALTEPNHPSPESSEPLKLSSRQVLALKCLANGVSITDAACTARVSRVTVHRWITEHPAFRAAYNRWKAAAQLSAQTQLIELQELAVEVVNEELETKRNGRLAALLLTKLGAMAGSAPGAMEPKRAGKEIETERLNRDIELARTAGDVHGRYYPREHFIRDEPPAAPGQDAKAGEKFDNT